jgi:tetratricopeptide (TPR) repeat protein
MKLLILKLGFKIKRRRKMQENDSHNIIFKSREFFVKAFKLQAEGLYEEAISNYKISLDYYPTPQAYTYLGWSYSLIGDYDRAIEECKNAIDLDPDYGNPYNDIGAYLINQNKYDEAVTWLELALKAKKYNHYEFAHINLGRVLEKKGLWFEALQEYKIATEIAPDYELGKKLLNNIQGLLN